MDCPSMISRNTKNACDYIPNLMGCLLFPLSVIPSSSTSTTTSSSTVSTRSTPRGTRSMSSRSSTSSMSLKKGRPPPSVQDTSTLNQIASLRITDAVYLNHGPRPLLEDSDRFINWRSQFGCNDIADTPITASMKAFITQNDGLYEDQDTVFIPRQLEEQWPMDDGRSQQKYDLMMMACAQRMFCDLTLKELTFEDMVSFIDSRYGHSFWNFTPSNSGNPTQSNQAMRSAVLDTVGKSVNTLIERQYIKFMRSELEWRLQVIMGNKKFSSRRSAHIDSKSLFANQRKIDSVQQWLFKLDIDHLDIGGLSDKEVTRKVKRIRESIESMDCVLRECDKLRVVVVEHLIQFPSKWMQSMTPIINRLGRRNKNHKATTQRQDSGTTLVYVLEDEVHVDPELCDFNGYLHFHRYLLTVISEMKKQITSEYAPKLREVLKLIGAEMVNSIWWRRRWEEREKSDRIEDDRKICKKLIFLNTDSTVQFLKRRDLNLRGNRLPRLFAIQQKAVTLFRSILKDEHVEPHSLAVHVKLDLLNHNQEVQEKVMKEIWIIVHDRDRPRGEKPKESILEIRRKAKQLLIQKEVEKTMKKRKRKRLRIQTSAQHLNQLASAAPSANDIQNKLHRSILKQRHHGQQRVHSQSLRTQSQQSQHRDYVQRRHRQHQRRQLQWTQNIKSITGKTRNGNKNSKFTSTTDSVVPALPALEAIDNNINNKNGSNSKNSKRDFNEPPPAKKRRKSHRIKGRDRPQYKDPQLVEYVDYQLEFALVWSFNEFLSSNLINGIIKNAKTDQEVQDEIKRVLVGMHFDVEDEHNEWFECIIDGVRVSAKKTANDNVAEDDCKTQSVITPDLSCSALPEILQKYDVRLRCHFKHFSVCWDCWINLPSPRIAPLRMYTKAYDATDATKPLAEILRELDEAQIVSIDHIASSIPQLGNDRALLVSWLNSEVEIEEETVDSILKWTKQFITENKQNLRIVRDYFVSAGLSSKKAEHLVCEVILPENVDAELRSLSEEEQDGVQQKVMKRLKEQKGCWLVMATESGVPLSLFEQIAFGITDLLPGFAIQRVVDWSHDEVLDDETGVLMEDPLLMVRVE